METEWAAREIKRNNNNSSVQCLRFSLVHRYRISISVFVQKKRTPTHTRGKGEREGGNWGGMFIYFSLVLGAK